MRTPSCLFLLLCFLLFQPPAYADGEKEYALEKLKKEGLSQEFIALVERAYLPDERDKIVETNVLGFLGRADYTGHYSAQAIKHCQKFMKRYAAKLGRVQKAYGVPKEVITALLWVETKFGILLGRHNVMHVYFSMIQSDHPDVMKKTLQVLSEKVDEVAAKENRQKTIDRSYAKANWALRELKSLHEIYKRRAKDVQNLKGSTAGAFGIPQFIPSSYLQWARPLMKSGNPNLFQMEHAIQSVGFYLKANGWDSSNSDSQQAALFHYNRAQGYVDVILKIAGELKN